jgi:UDP-N-acetylmuramate dehydrogenase
MNHFQTLLAQSAEAGVDYGRLTYDRLLAPYTTYKIGGPADVFAEPSTPAQLLNLMQIITAQGEPWMTIGRGSNLLIGDRGIRGVVIHLGKGFDTVEFNGTSVTAGSACSFVKLAMLSAKQGLSGFEFAGGIPGSVGGAVYMNAGAHGSDISKLFKSAELVLANGKLVHYDLSQMDFAYRHSVLHEEAAILVSSTFALTPGDATVIAEKMATLKAHRQRTQPLTAACCGSVFRNPPGDYAARLIEAAGLKGSRVGGAIISNLHANFIVNTGQATATDVLELIARVQVTIMDQYGIALKPEVLAVGER